MFASYLAISVHNCLQGFKNVKDFLELEFYYIKILNTESALEKWFNFYF